MAKRVFVAGLNAEDWTWIVGAFEEIASRPALREALRDALPDDPPQGILSRVRNATTATQTNFEMVIAEKEARIETLEDFIVANGLIVPNGAANTR